MANDGSISIKISVDGKEVEVASKDLERLEGAGERSGKGAKAAEDGMRGVSQESSKASGNVKKFATSLGLVAIGAMAFRTLRNSMDDAISRFDTMNNFPKVLQSLGVSAEDSEKSVNKLSDGIDGLPTKLDDIAGTAQRMYTSFGDMDVATDSALALNNALLSQSASADQVRRGTEMYLKALQTGQMDLMTWRSLSETMDVALVKIADSFGYVGNSAKDDLYKALQDGTVTIDQFNGKLIELGTGTGELADLARKNSVGLATSWANLQTAFARGVTVVIESLNRLSEKATGRGLAENIDSLKIIVFASFEAIAKAIDATTPVVMFFAGAIKALVPIINALTPLIAGLTASYISLLVINKATAAFGLLTGAMNISTIATVAKTAALTALRIAMTALSGPVGWVSAGIGAVAAGAVAVVKWFKRTSAEAKRLNKETEDLSDATDELTDSVEQNQKAYEDGQREIKSSAKAYDSLVDKVEELAKKENKSASDKALLNSYIDQLNDSVEGLNLSYDEQANALSMSSEQLKARVDLVKEEESLTSAQERLLEIEQERNEAQMKKKEINALQREWVENLNEGNVSSSEATEKLEELDEKEKELISTMSDLTEQQKVTEEQIETSMENITEAIESGVTGQILDYESLKDHQKEAFDNMISTYEELVDGATDAFDRMNDESKVTAEEMFENLKHNQKVTEEWGENIAKLYEFAAKEGHEGFMEWLDKLGPDSAAELAVIAGMSEDELSRFADLMDKGAELAGESFKTSLNNEFDEAVDVMIDFVDASSMTLKQQMEGAGFDEIGMMIPLGVVEGTEEGTPEAEKATEDMIKATEEAARKQAEIQSPSRVFMRIGDDMTEGLSLGISDGTMRVLNTSKKLLESTVDVFKNTPSQFSVIGLDAMTGLSAGLEAGRRMVLNKARSIAHDVTRTMQSALRIQSPSIVMRDDVGKWIPEGIAVGIDDNTSVIDHALNNLSQKMIKVSPPEIALGTSMARAGSVQQSIAGEQRGASTRTSNEKASNQPVYVQSILHMNSREVARSTWQDVSKYINDDWSRKIRSQGIVSAPRL